MRIAATVVSAHFDAESEPGKDSGTGREGLRYSIEEMTERKLMVLKVLNLR